MAEQSAAGSAEGMTLRWPEAERITHSLQALTRDMLAAVERYHPGLGLTPDDFGALNADKIVYDMHEEFTTAALAAHARHLLDIGEKLAELLEYVQAHANNDALMARASHVRR